MKLVASFIICVLLFSGLRAHATDLAGHFLGSGPCRIQRQPVLLVTDTTKRGEIDDSISLLIYRELERRRCVKLIGIVSVFGNGRSSTRDVHESLLSRIRDLGLTDWEQIVFRGPDRRAFGDMTVADSERLGSIASVVNGHRSVVIVELGPLTVSARLIMHEFVLAERIVRILGVGGRSAGERFTTGKGLGSLFEFRDMNIAEDTAAAAYLVRRHAEKLWLVTYRTGVDGREVLPEQVAAYASKLADHAHQRARVLRRAGYSAIPSWDTWTSSYFLKDGAAGLGCNKTRAAMRHHPGSRDQMQLHLHLTKGGREITACHASK